MFSDPITGSGFGTAETDFRVTDIAPNKSVRSALGGSKLTISHQPGTVNRSLVRIDTPVAIGDDVLEASAYLVFVRPKAMSNGDQAALLGGFTTDLLAAFDDSTGEIPVSRFVALEP